MAYALHCAADGAVPLLPVGATDGDCVGVAGVVGGTALGEAVTGGDETPEAVDVCVGLGDPEETGGWVVLDAAGVELAPPDDGGAELATPPAGDALAPTATATELAVAAGDAVG